MKVEGFNLATTTQYGVIIGGQGTLDNPSPLGRVTPRHTHGQTYTIPLAAKEKARVLLALQ